MRVTTFLAVALCGALLASTATAQQVVNVATVAELQNAVGAAMPGHIITLADGVYNFAGVANALTASADGTQGLPITVKAANPGQAELQWGSTSGFVEGFKVQGKYWTFEDLVIVGTCTPANHGLCEHAFHVTHDADFFVMRNSVLRDFNAMLKVNIGNGLFPDDGLVEGCELYNTIGRETGAPVTPLNIDGGRRWMVRNNFVHDAYKNGGNGVSYQAFMKSNGRDGVFDSNIIQCFRDIPTGGTRIGLSFGGGGTSPDSVCEDGTCNPEHQNGIMRNNIIINCNDVGVYVNECAGCTFVNNLLYDTNGLDCRFDTSTCTVSNNVVAGGNIRERDGGTVTNGGNAIVSTGEILNALTDPEGLDFSPTGAAADVVALFGTAALDAGVPTDYCGNTRADPTPRGPLAFNDAGFVLCDTSTGIRGGGFIDNSGSGEMSSDIGGLTDAATTAAVSGLVALAAAAAAVLVAL